MIILVSILAYQKAVQHLKSTSANAFTMRNTREKLQGDAPLPVLANHLFRKYVREKERVNWLESSQPGLDFRLWSN